MMLIPTAIYFGWSNSRQSEEIESILQRSFNLVFAEHFEFGDEVDQQELSKLGADFLFSFGPQIVRKPLIDSINFGAINFHTAPPKWPGRGSCSMALLDGDAEFGVTAHIMTVEVDAGPILRVIRFPIDEEDDAETLREKTLNFIPKLVVSVVEDLRGNDWKPVSGGESWERKAIRQREVIEMMRLSEADSDETIRKKIKAFAHSKKPGPFIERAGFRFWYMKGLE